LGLLDLLKSSLSKVETSLTNYSRFCIRILWMIESYKCNLQVHTINCLSISLTESIIERYWNLSARDRRFR
jgi:hypothetical protein